MPPRRLLAILAILAGVGGCSHYPTDWQTTQFPAPSWNPPQLARPVTESRQETVAQPGYGNYHHRRVGILLFRTPANLPEVSQPVTRVFYQKLLVRRPFVDVVFIPLAYGSVEEALALTRERRLDLLLLGEVPYFLDGGTLGQSGLQMDVKVVEVKTGRLLWYLTDSLKATPRPPVDLWVTETRPQPTPGIYALAEQVADRLCRKLEGGVLVGGGPGT